MSVCGHTCRHVLHRASSRLDSVWISDELLSSTFKRFVKNQRRYGSQVPGPLEASKRLAKRRNTALAVGGSSSSFDPAANVANLFGANGTGHVRQWDDSAWSSRWPEPLELFSYSDQPPPPPLPSFLAQTANPAEHLSDIGGNLPYEHDNFTSLLAECRSVEDVNDALEWFRVDVREDPEYSRIIFRHLFDLTTHENNTRAVHELLIFLDDASLNVYGVGNHSELIGRLSSSGLAMSHKAKLVKNVTKAMSLGLVPVGEINRILQLLPSITGHGQSLDTVLEDVWDALQSCSLFKLHEIGQDVLEPWIDQLLAMNQTSSLRLAKEVMFTYKESLKVLADSYALRALEVLSSRMPLSVTSHDLFTTFLRQLLARSDNSSLKIAKDIALIYHRHESRSPQPIAEILCHHLFTQVSHDSSKDISHFMVDLLGQLSPDIATRYIVLITEGITFVDRGDEFRSHRLKIWRNCLLQLERRAILSSREWYEPKIEGCVNASKGLKIALRIWAWMSLNTTPHRKLKRPHSGHSDEKNLNAVGISLLKIFDEVTTSIMWRFHGNRTEILPKLVAGLQQLDVPCSQVLSKAYTLMSHRHIKNQSTLQAFQKLEEGRLTLAQAALQRHVFNSTKHYLLSSHLRFIQEIDVTSPEFIAKMVDSIEKDNGRIRDMIFIISLHTPLKIALAMASTRNAGHVANTKRVKATLRLERKGKQLYLEPHACVSFVHLLASSIALSEKVSPRAAFNLLTYLYRYLISHNAPVKPGFARALYHCGITRFSRGGLRVSAAQEDHIMEIVRRHEEPEAAQALMSGSYIECN